MRRKFTGMAPILCILLAVFAISPDSMGAAPASGPHAYQADKAALVKWITHESDCDDSGQPAEINDLQYFDFDHDGRDELVVTASTCNTGTAGPDVHSVFFREPNGAFREFALPDVDRKYYQPMIGNRNFDVSIVRGAIVATWHDRSNRPLPPLVITYVWNGIDFIPRSIRSPYLHER